MLNWMYHKPTIEELVVPSDGETLASCLPTAEFTIVFPAAIAAKVSPHEANAPPLSPISTAPHITSFVQVPAKSFFITLLLLDLRISEQGREKSCSPRYLVRAHDVCLARKFPAMQTGSRPLHFHNTV